MEMDFIERDTNLKPILKEKYQKLDARINLLRKQANATIDASVRRMKFRAIEQLEEQIQEVQKQLVEFDVEDWS